MRAAVITAPDTMLLAEFPEPPDPGHGEVLVAPEAVGLCGSDYHFYDGTLSPAAGGGQFPRVLGHEVGSRIEAIGAGCPAELEVGQRVAMLPLIHCGHCYPCRIGRTNRCANFQLVGIHLDGGLQERLLLPAAQVYPIDTDSPGLAALVEPVSIAMRALTRVRLQAGEQVVILGAGPIGQALALACADRRADVLIVDPIAARLDVSRGFGVVGLVWESAAQVESYVSDWTGGDGAPVVIDATGVAEAVHTGAEIVALAGRLAIVGMSGAEVSLRVGMFSEKEVDVLGVCCCGDGEFAAAVDLVQRRGDALRPLITHEFDLERAPDAIAFAIANPTDVMKVIVRT